jgi:hypothetical protein
MRRLVTLLIAASMLALPAAALAQSAGDEQYADPFGQVKDPNSGQGQQSQAPAQSAPTPAQTAAPANTADQAVASQTADAPTLPRTGLPAWYLALYGAVLLLAGTALRRRFS